MKNNFAQEKEMKQKMHIDEYLYNSSRPAMSLAHSLLYF